jgi:hypothetical protein
MRADLLHVIAVSFNPRRFKSHVNNYTAFEKHMLESGVQLTVVECAYGDIPHGLVNDGINHVPVYAKNPIWVKEALINIGISRLPRDWKYVAWIDADIIFENPTWAEEIVYALQHYDFIQPWSDCLDISDTGGLIGKPHKSFCHQWVNEPKTCSMMGKSGYTFAHPGYAWAATRSALEATGGLIETAVLGSGDHHMSLAMIGKAELSIPVGVTEAYAAPILRWQDRCKSHINGNISYIPGTIRHLYHGQKENRQYISRWDILKKHNFDPYVDIKYNTSGVPELAGNKPELKRDIMAYFASRNEDATVL